MAKNKKSRRNPSRSIKIHNRDEILKRVIDERSGKARGRKSRSTEIREEVYERSSGTRRRRETTAQTKTQASAKTTKKKKGISLKGAKATPKLTNVFLPREKKSPGEYMDPKQRSQRQGHNVAAVLIGLIVFVCVVSYAVILCVKYMQRSVVSNDTIIYDSIESAQKCTGVIVRDEIVYNSPTGGEAVFNVSDLDKVKAGTEICSVQDTETVQNLQQDLDLINEKILEMQKTRENISIVSNEVKQYNAQIKSGSDNYAFRLTGGDISVLYTMKGDIQKIIDTRNQRLLSENSSGLSELAEQRAQQQSKISNSKNAVVTQDAGVVSCYSDGLESKYTFAVMGDLTEKDISVKNSGKVIDKIVESGEPIFKIVKSNEWYIVSYISNQQIENWAVGDNVMVYIDDQSGTSRPIEVQIASINTGEKQSLVILKSTKYLVDFINTRSVTFETNKIMKGYKLPNEAIVEETLLKVPSGFVSGNKVYKKNESGTLIEVNVEVSGENTEEGVTYIVLDINKIKVGDILAMEKDASKTYTIGDDVVTIKGVYVMNTGDAVFRKINLENSSSNQNFTVLDPALNQNIKIYDRIVTDTTNTEKQQKLIE